MVIDPAATRPDAKHGDMVIALRLNRTGPLIAAFNNDGSGRTA